MQNARRARTGKCFHRPYFGVREFAADFDYEADADAAFTRRQAELKDEWEAWDEDLGLMLYDVFDYKERAAGFRWLSDEELKTQLEETSTSVKRTPKKKPPVLEEGRRIAPVPTFFKAEIKNSILACHPDEGINLIRGTNTQVDEERS